MRFFLLIFTVAMLWGGTQTLYTVLSNLEPTELTIEQIEQSPTDKKWLLVKGGHLDLTEAVTSSFLGVGEVKEVYLPVRTEGAEEGDPVAVVLATKNRAMLDVVNRMAKIEDEAEAVKFAIQNIEVLHQQKDVKGLVRFGIEMDDSDERDLRKLIPELTSDFVVIDEGKSPEWPMIMMLFMGLASGYAFIRMGGRKTPPPLPGRAAPPPFPAAPGHVGPPPMPQ